MKVFVAGATGAIGRPLVRLLLDRGHEVTAVTRDQHKAADLGRMGVNAVVADAADERQMTEAMSAARPDTVISELTSLPQRFDPKRIGEYYAANSRIRLDGTKALLAAAAHANVQRFVSQSAAFWYRPTPGPVKTEEDPFDTDAPEPVGSGARTMLEVEELVSAASGSIGVNLRYATFYGPGTWYSPDGDIGQRLAKRQFPVIGSGEAVMSFVHVDDAALATVMAMESGKPGTHNVADDEPAVAKEWIPHFASAIGAPRPMKIPVLVARLAVPRPMLHMVLNGRAASNERIKRELGWRPRFASWRDGFREGLGPMGRD